LSEDPDLLRPQVLDKRLSRLNDAQQLPGLSGWLYFSNWICSLSYFSCD